LKFRVVRSTSIKHVSAGKWNDEQLAGRKTSAHGFVYCARDPGSHSRSQYATKNHVDAACRRARSVVFRKHIFPGSTQSARASGLVPLILADLRMANVDGNAAGGFRFADRQIRGAQSAAPLAAGTKSAKVNARQIMAAAKNGCRTRQQMEATVRTVLSACSPNGSREGLLVEAH
jgi:hypothetical protein